MLFFFLPMLAHGLGTTSGSGQGTSNTNSGSATSSNSSITNPVTGASAEYPLTEGSGTTVRDISGNNNTASFCGSVPTWTTYGLSFTSGCVQTPILTFGTAYVHLCPNASAQLGSAGFLASNLASNGIAFATNYFSSFSQMMFVAPSIWRLSNSTWPSRLNPFSSPSNCIVAAIAVGATDHIYVNGIEPSYGAQGSSSSIVTIGSTGYVFGNGGASGVFPAFQGTINYVMFYPTQHTAAQVLAVTNYINAVVNTRPSFPKEPSQGTANTVASQLLCTGDSLTNGFGGAPWCNSTYITPLTNTYTINYAAYNGRAAFDQIAYIKTNFTPILSPSSGRVVCHMWLGVNDVREGLTAAQGWVGIQNVGRQLNRLGCITTVSTIISNSGFETQREALNVFIRAGWRSVFAALDDLAAVPALGADGANTDTNCFLGDKVHLTGPGAGTCYNSLTGYSVAATQTAKIVNLLDGSTVDNPTFTTSASYVQAIGDNYVVQTAATAATNTLIDCTGLTSVRRTIVNGSGTNAITAQTSASQTITGSATIAANTIAAFECELTDPLAGGNYWLRVQ